MGPETTNWVPHAHSHFSMALVLPHLASPGWQPLIVLRRYYHPSPPQRTIKTERTFEGISLDTPGQSSNRVLQMTRFQLCAKCYQQEASQGGLECLLHTLDLNLCWARTRCLRVRP